MRARVVILGHYRYYGLRDDEKTYQVINKIEKYSFCFLSMKRKEMLC